MAKRTPAEAFEMLEAEARDLRQMRKLAENNLEVLLVRDWYTLSFWSGGGGGGGGVPLSPVSMLFFCYSFVFWCADGAGGVEEERTNRDSRGLHIYSNDD